MTKLLDKINYPSDLRKFDNKYLRKIAYKSYSIKFNIY